MVWRLGGPLRAGLVLPVALLAIACGSRPAREAGTGDGQASGSVTATAASAANAAAISAADRAAILKASSLTADAQGRVQNDCGELVTPQFLTPDLGAKVGPAVLLVMTGGPKQPTCYGDGPGLTLLRNAAGKWQEIYSSRGGMLVVMKDMHGGAPDIAHGGPGLSHPVFEWNGTAYQSTKREVRDDSIGDVTILP